MSVCLYVDVVLIWYSVVSKYSCMIDKDKYQDLTSIKARGNKW